MIDNQMENQQPIEVIQPTAIESMQRAEFDMQIATAKRFPRQLAQVKSSMLSFATLDEETAAACFYSLPRGGKTIQGPSVRLAEIALSSYKNMRAGTRILESHPDGENPYVVVQGMAFDIENNIAIQIEKRRRITKKKNAVRVDDDDINLAVNSCAAIAFRDAVFKVIPGALIKPVMEQAKKVAVGDAATLADRRAKAVAAFAKMGVGQDRILALLEKSSVEEITIADLETLVGLFTAIKDGQTTIDDSFPEVAKVGKKPDIVTPPAGSAEAPKRRGRPPKQQAQPQVATDPEPTPEPAESSEPSPGVASVPDEAQPVSKQDALEETLTNRTISLGAFAKWCADTGRDKLHGCEPDSWTSFAEVPEVLCDAVLSDPKLISKIALLYGAN